MVGLLTGLIGYLAFGTERGEDFRDNLREKFEEARETLYKEGLIESADMSIPEVVEVLREKAETLFETATKSKSLPKPKKREKFRGL